MGSDRGAKTCGSRWIPHEVRSGMTQRCFALVAVFLLAMAMSCSRRGDIVGLNPVCKEPEAPTRVSCDEAVLVARAVAVSHHVTTGGPKAQVKPEAVTKGEAVAASSREFVLQTEEWLAEQ